MQGFLTFLSLVIWGAAWFLIVKYRGRRSLFMGNVWGAIFGLVVAMVFVAVTAPEQTYEEKVAAENQRRDSEISDAKRTADSDAVPSEALDNLMLIYINHKVYAGPVSCTPKLFGARAMVGCRSGDSAPHVWHFSKGKFLSINGSAKGLAETQFASEPIIGTSPLPLASDIDVGAIVKAFSKS